MPLPLALVGVGKIARDQHAPALAASPDFALAATVSLEGALEGVPGYTTIADMLAAHPDVAVLSLCVPPRPRFHLAAEALNAGRHVMLEKPPGASLAECRTLAEMAQARRVALYASWHSREAAGVGPARDWLAGRRIRGVRVDWKENVRQWHPGQAWIFESGGLGVFDPAINALSILTEILPVPFHVVDATLRVPENVQAPIAAEIAFYLPENAPMTMALDFLKEGGQIWRIEVKTDGGALVLSEGGARLDINGHAIMATDDTLSGEYPRLYARMAQTIAATGVDIDLAPMTHVADAFLVGRRIAAPPFHETAR
jgi:D-galactose 1-dehydrogenase